MFLPLKQLIPSGVFTRLQVRHKNSCDVSNHESCRMGFCWSSFMRGGIQVVVRFGGQSKQDMLLQCPGATSTSNVITELATGEYNNPEWIDILLFYPKDLTRTRDLDHTMNQIMHDTKTSIFDICQSTYRSTPYSRARGIDPQKTDGVRDAMISLANVKIVISKQGPNGRVDERQWRSRPVVELLIPQELKGYARSRCKPCRKYRMSS
ncbi:hypothetical protein GOP47_0025133 [Adiantum capillus-veneris]|uniref:Uncharacterized protein n=1 Tax=Adiantum capillus-veneris TaxID=13818 RepID=A0A9D4Z378_ADICA|nr:hypothetical protein GOP47_0025133 [Adiantum capillus-veneris]